MNIQKWLEDRYGHIVDRDIRSNNPLLPKYETHAIRYRLMQAEFSRETNQFEQAEKLDRLTQKTYDQAIAKLSNKEQENV